MPDNRIPSYLQPISQLLADPQVTEIMVNGPDKIYTEIKGRLSLTGLCWPSEEALVGAIQEIGKAVGRPINNNNPLIDCRLPDGSRINAVLRPVGVFGPTLNIRKFSAMPWTTKELVANGTLNFDAARFLEKAVAARANILVAGGTGSGKTTLLGFLSTFIGSDERVITIEDVAELKLNQPHWVALETKPADTDEEEITVRRLVKNALRMRPDRIIVGEVRGAEALDMLQAMNTGHDGSLSTIHANSSRDALSRLETLVLFAGVELPVAAIRKQITSAIQLIVFLGRLSDGSRRVLSVTELQGLQGEAYTLQDVFAFHEDDRTAQGAILGQLKKTGFPSRWD